MATSLPTASSLGILADGTDQTSAINTALANADYEGIIFDYSPAASVTVTGTVSGSSKLLRFYPGNMVIGTGTLDSCVYDADYEQQIFDTDLSHTNAKSAYDMTSVKWWGAKGDGSTDDHAALQKASDTVIANTTLPRKLYVPGGEYVISCPWILHNWNGTEYGQFNIQIYGYETAPSSPTIDFPKINATSITQTFAIGVQEATGGGIWGLIIIGPFTTSMDYDTFVATTYASASGGTSVIRDETYSPNAGIVIDPFANSSTQVPPDGGYPDYTSWYRGTGAGTGTTGFDIIRCLIQGFTVDICNSPNGSTQQGENCNIEDCQLDYCNVAISYGQTQSDQCQIKNIRSWYYIWTALDSQTYGTGGTCANVEGWNVAGIVNTLFNVNTYKALTIKDFYAEAFFQVGTLTTSNTTITVIGCNFDFNTDSALTPQYHITNALNVNFVGGRMRYYDDLFNKRLRFQYWNRVLFENVWFDLPPYNVYGDWENQGPNAVFINCTVGESRILGMRNDLYTLQSAGILPVLYGKFTIQDSAGLNDNGYDGSTYNPINTAVTYAYDSPGINNNYIYGFATSQTVTPDSSRQATITANTSVCLVNDLVFDEATNDCIGRISAIDTGAGTVTLSEIPINITSTTYDSLYLVYFLSIETPFVGDVTNGSQNVTNVSLMWTYPPVAGQRIDHPAFALGTYIVSYDGGTTTAVMSTAAAKTEARQSFVNGSPVITANSLYPPSSADFATYPRAFASGTVWNELPSYHSSAVQLTRWVFNKGGYLDASGLGLGSAYQADFNIEPLLRNNGGTIQYYDSYADSWINV